MEKALDLCSWTLSTVLGQRIVCGMTVLTELITLDALMIMMLGSSANQVLFHKPVMQ